MVENLTGRKLEYLRFERPRRTMGERIIPSEDLPVMLEAAGLEGVLLEIEDFKGKMLQEASDGETINEISGAGLKRIKAFTSKVSLGTFWNTFYALRDYDRPIPQG